jgi:hypothetical protein
MINFLKIHDPGIIVILAREYDVIKVGGMCICERVLIGIPSSETQIETSHERNPAVD